MKTTYMCPEHGKFTWEDGGDTIKCPRLVFEGSSGGGCNHDSWKTSYAPTFNQIFIAFLVLTFAIGIILALTGFTDRYGNFQLPDSWAP